MSLRPHQQLRSQRFRALWGLILVSAAGACTCQEKLEEVKGTVLVAPASYDFGSVSPGEVSETSFQVKNVGRGTIIVKSIALQTPDSHVVIGDVLTLDCNAKPRTGPDPTVLQSDDCAEFTVRYSPGSTAAMSNTILLDSENATNPQVKIPITGEAPSPKLCATPASLSFGSLPVGTTKTLPVKLTNCGGVNYELTKLDLAGSSGDFMTPAAGSTGAIPTLPYPLSVGASVTVDVTFAPSSATTETDSLVATAGVAGTVYQTVTVPITGTGEATGCGTTTNLTPTAVIKVLSGSTVEDPTSAIFAPLTQVTLDATGSTVPAGSGETITSYNWTLVSQPMGSVTSLTNAASKQAGLYMEIIGEYVVQLVVGTNEGAMSCPVQVKLEVNSTAGIHVQLTWAENYGDVDLHYIGPGGSFYESTPHTGDLDWTSSLATAVGAVTPTANCGGITGISCSSLSPDWGGTPGVAPDHTAYDDASLDVDQRWGSGPENVTHPHPFDGTYKVSVHYFCSYKNETPTGRSFGPANATIKVFVRGVLAWTGTMDGMTDDQVWDAAEIVVTNTGTNVTVNGLSTALYAGGQGCAAGL
jgi:hypothetical protein